MKIDVNDERQIVLKEVFSGVLLETEEGNKVGICMRDDTFEISVIKKDGEVIWHRVDPESGDITEMKKVLVFDEGYTAGDTVADVAGGEA